MAVDRPGDEIAICRATEKHSSASSHFAAKIEQARRTCTVEIAEDRSLQSLLFVATNPLSMMLWSFGQNAGGRRFAQRPFAEGSVDPWVGIADLGEPAGPPL
jgi:hypothetical protein